MANIGPQNTVGGYNSGDVDWNAFYSGIVPQQPRPAIASNRPTPAQLAAMQAVPSGSYQTPPNRPITAPNIPSGSQYANTGNLGRATPAMQQLLGLASAGGGRPPWTVQPPAAPASPNVPLPRPRPGFAPNWMDMAAMNQQQGANPGMGGAMLGNGQMSPQIPPQQPPADGSSPLPVWAGNNPQQAGGGGTVQRANGTNGYIYGRAEGGPWSLQGTNRAPGIGPAQQYAAANLMGQVNALNRQAAGRAAGLTTPVERLRSQGMSSADAYAAANAGPGSVAAMEARHSGGSTYAGGQAGGGSILGSNGGPPPQKYYDLVNTAGREPGGNPQQSSFW